MRCLVLVGREDYKEGYDSDISTIHYKMELDEALTISSGQVTSASHFPHVKEYNISEKHECTDGFGRAYAV